MVQPELEGSAIHLTVIPPSSSSTNNHHNNENNVPNKIEIKLFLFHFLSLLHLSGHLTYRTEKYIYRVGKKYGIHATATILFRRAILSFQELNSLDSTSSETYTFGIKSGWKYGNLLLLDQLCFDILQRDLSFEKAQERLELINQNPWSYSWYTVLFAFGCSSFGATTLFFGGTWVDGGWAFLFGLIAYYVDYLSEKLAGFSEISCFVTSFVISLIASLLDKYVYDGSLCLFAQVFGGVVWLLPGITITIGLLEIYSQMPMYGSARLIYGVSLASQLGFGMVLGYMLASQRREIPDSFINGCRDPIPPSFGFILVPIIAMSFGVLISSAYRQIPGMILTCGTGFASSFIAFHSGVDPSAIPFIAAMAVTVVGRVYAYLDGNQRPFTYMMTGLLVLVPGSVGVRGMSDMWSGDSQMGMEVTFRMLLIAVSLSMGHFLALVPSQKWLLFKVHHESNPKKLFGDIEVSIINPMSSHSYRHRVESMDSGYV